MAGWSYNSPMVYRLQNALLLCFLLCLGLITSHSISAQPVQPIIILSPGGHSVVTAPIHVTGLVHPGEGALVRVTLVDQQQNLLTRQVLRVNGSYHEAVEFTAELAFEIPVESSTAFLTVVTLDHVNRPIAMRSVPLTLQSSGELSIEPQLSTDPWLAVNQPKPGAIINDSPIIVAGTVSPINDRPVIFELITDRGSVIVTRQMAVETVGEMVAFEMPLPYSPSSRIRDIRLVIRQSSGIAGVNVILDSLPLTIVP
jgi:hypothetical protein